MVAALVVERTHPGSTPLGSTGCRTGGLFPRICFLQVLDFSRGATMGLRCARRLQGSVRLW